MLPATDHEILCKKETIDPRFSPLPNTLGEARMSSGENTPRSILFMRVVHDANKYTKKTAFMFFIMEPHNSQFLALV